MSLKQVAKLENQLKEIWNLKLIWLKNKELEEQGSKWVKRRI
jgi:isoprenylcysteine carboxyl methyltransferase (ICMT) family protein YpbQ